MKKNTLYVFLSIWIVICIKFVNKYVTPRPHIYHKKRKFQMYHSFLLCLIVALFPIFQYMLFSWTSKEPFETSGWVGLKESYLGPTCTWVKRPRGRVDPSTLKFPLHCLLLVALELKMLKQFKVSHAVILPSKSWSPTVHFLCTLSNSQQWNRP